MKTKVQFMLMLFAAMVITSCNKNNNSNDEETTMEDIVVSDDFNWSSGLKGQLTVSFDNPDNVSTEDEYINIVDKNGNKLYTTMIKDGKAVFDVNLPDDGEYYVYFPVSGDSAKIEGTGSMTMTLSNTLKAGFKSANHVSEVVSCTNCDKPMENGGAELPDIVKNYKIISEDLVPGWKTTASDHKIEVWKTGFLGVPAQEGTQFMEINANMSAALYQELCIKPGANVTWSVWHRGRAGVDVARVRIGATVESAGFLVKMEDGKEWVHYTGTYKVPENQETTVFVFEAVSTANGNPSSGNFIDNFEIECDFDGDGVPDDSDDNPDDSTSAFTSYFPTSGKQIVAFEDLWPSLGDFDFNDVVLATKAVFNRNDNQELLSADFKVSIDAIGAGMDNGIGMMLYNSDGEAIGQNIIDNVSGDASVDEGNVNGIILTENVFETTDHRYQNNGAGKTTDQPDTLKFSISFVPGYSGELTPELYIFRTYDRSHEVHRSNFPGTAVMNNSLFHTEDDNGNFKTKNNLPWGMEIITEENFMVPIENTQIIFAYPQFSDWATSDGAQNKTWYLYPDESKVVDIFAK